MYRTRKQSPHIFIFDGRSVRRACIADARQARWSR